jgi:tetratricopeptide (TPR) repeat protein
MKNMREEENPISILVVTSRPLIDVEGRQIVLLDVAEERRRIATGLKNSRIHAHVHFLPEATTGAVKEALRNKWDLIHFTGHATRDGHLVLEDSFGVAHFLSKQQVKQLLPERQIPLAVLSACHSEIIAQALSPSGIPTVIAIDARTPIADQAATIFAEHFYSALTKGWDFQAAYLDAQGAVALDPAVGDATPPIDGRGNPESPWSQRFKLIGEGRRFLKVSVGVCQESGAHLPSIRNLRERNVNFVGRAREIVDVVKEFDLSKSRRVAIIGTGGLGKTETSKAVGWWYMERSRVDAVLWASASSDEGEYKLRDLASLLTISMRVFGLPVREQIQFEEQKKVVRELFSSRRILLILDNWETVELQNRRELWNFVLSLPDSARVLITSRDVLPAKDARNLELNTLAPDDATRLFLKVARNAGYFDRNPHLSNDETAILNSICERLSGYPLAIEVVAGQTFSRTLSEIWADLLRVPKDVMESKDEITGEPRGVWTSLDLSYNLLPDNERSIFQQMGAMLVPASGDDITAITKINNPRTVLDTLIRRSLVQMREGSYVLLPIVRDYAKSKLVEAGLDLRELHERAASYYTEKGTLPDALIASEHLFEVAQQCGSKETAQKFIDYVADYYHQLVSQGRWGAARRKAEQALTLSRSVADEKQFLDWNVELANMSARTGDYEQAMEIAKQNLVLAERLGDKRLIAYILHNLAVCHRYRWNYPEALKLLQQSLAISGELDDKQAIANTLGEMGTISDEEGDSAKALKYYRQSGKIFKEIGDVSGGFRSMHNTATVLQRQRNYSKALEIYQLCLDYAAQTGAKSNYVKTLQCIAMIYEEQGAYNKAFELFEEALAIAEELGDKHTTSELLLGLGTMAQYQGNYAQMRGLYTQCYEIAEELGDKSLMARLLHNDGIVYQHEGKYPQAAHQYEGSLKLKEEIGDRAGAARSLSQLGNVEQLRGNPDSAAGYYQKSLKLREEIGDRQAIATAQAQLGGLEANRGNYAEGGRLCLQALKTYQKFGAKREMAQALFQLGQIAWAQKQIREAFIYVYQARSLFVELKHQYGEMAMSLLQKIMALAGREQYERWLEDLSTGSDSSAHSDVDESGETLQQELTASLINIAESVSNADQLTEEQRASLLLYLVGTEKEMRKQGFSDIADFFGVLQGLLTGKDVKDKIAGLDGTLKEIAEQAWDWLN